MLWSMDDFSLGGITSLLQGWILLSEVAAASDINVGGCFVPFLLSDSFSQPMGINPHTSVASALGRLRPSIRRAW